MQPFTEHKVLVFMKCGLLFFFFFKTLYLGLGPKDFSYFFCLFWKFYNFWFMFKYVIKFEQFLYKTWGLGWGLFFTHGCTIASTQLVEKATYISFIELHLNFVKKKKMAGLEVILSISFWLSIVFHWSMYLIIWHSLEYSCFRCLKIVKYDFSQCSFPSCLSYWIFFVFFI